MTSKLERQPKAMDSKPTPQTVTMDSVILALELAMQARDPYTVGHQQRVAEIACLLGEKLGLEADRLEDLRLAANLHDLGKMAIPGEILSKPTRLSADEFALIKTHPQVSLDILQPLNLPARVSSIVLQHHERLNGSGYPHSLQGDEIILEARILAVADVLEAICSHRPYRASLGLKAALEELIRNKDILFDAAVVDACLELYQEGPKGHRHATWKPTGRHQKIAREASRAARKKAAMPPKPARRRPLLGIPSKFLLHSVATSLLASMILMGAHGGF
jgi:putative nucleotidyltransferase with HDIG domain